MTEKLLKLATLSEIAACFQSSESTIRGWQHKEGFPQPVATPAGKEPLYSIAAIEKWLDIKSFAKIRESQRQNLPLGFETYMD